MASKSLNEVIVNVIDGEDSDSAFNRLFAHQIRPCDFRRWFTQVAVALSNLAAGQQITAEMLPEISAEMLEKLLLYQSEGMSVDEAFQAHCPDYVSPGHFLSAYLREMKSRKAGQPATLVADDGTPPQSTSRRRKKPAEAGDSLSSSSISEATAEV